MRQVLDTANEVIGKPENAEGEVALQAGNELDEITVQVELLEAFEGIEAFDVGDAIFVKPKLLETGAALEPLNARHLLLGDIELAERRKGMEAPELQNPSGGASAKPIEAPDAVRSQMSGCASIMRSVPWRS
jgi:hypothetical protein